MQLEQILTLTPHGPDTFVGAGPTYPWGGLYGGQIMSQALMAAAQTVEGEWPVHSLHAYFIRRGDAKAPIRFEVDRIRDGRTFATRRVVARQAAGAIFNMSTSFHSEGSSAMLQTHAKPDAPDPESLASRTWSPAFDRKVISGLGDGRVRSWFRANAPLPDAPIFHACALGFMSDDSPAESLLESYPDPNASLRTLWMASLDHAIWFHRPFRADQWLLHDFEVQAIAQGRGLSIGHVFTADGQHVATVSQEVLGRMKREEPKG